MPTRNPGSWKHDILPDLWKWSGQQKPFRDADIQKVEWKVVRRIGPLYTTRAEALYKTVRPARSI